MPASWNDIEELKRDYYLLAVPISASAQAIRQAYHRMVKRWHPDLYPNGSREQTEATQMMKQLNEAYAHIQHAPLRYNVESYPKVKQARERAQTNYRGVPVPVPRPQRENLPVTDRMEFWVRFACGALFGLFVSFGLIFRLFDQPFAHDSLIAVLVCAVGTLGCGFVAARQGDRFWYDILGSSWYWWT